MIIKLENLHTLEAFLNEKGFKLNDIIHLNEKNENQLYEHGILNFFEYRRLLKHIPNLTKKMLVSQGTLNVKDLHFQRRTEKIRHLSKWLLDNHKIELYKAISITEKKMNKIITGYKYPNDHLSKTIASYFFMNEEILLVNTENLPKDEVLKVDEVLVAAQLKNYENLANINKSKHFISRSYRVLEPKRRVKLFIALFANFIPLAGFTVLSAAKVINDKANIESQFTQNINEADEIFMKEKFPLINASNDCAKVDINVGTEIYSISNLDASTNSYSISMKLMFDFNQFDYYRMFMEQKYQTKISESIADCVDDYYRMLPDGTFESGSDYIPDILQIKGYGVFFQGPGLDVTKFAVNQNYLDCVSFYPGEYSSNNLPNKNSMFQLIGGSVNADSFGYDICQGYTLTTYQSDGITIASREFRYFQLASFDASMHYAFKSATYPLDSAQINLTISPRMFTTEALRYVPVEEVNLSNSNRIIKGDNRICAPDLVIYKNGRAASFYVTGGYSMLEGDFLDRYNNQLSTSKKYGLMQQTTYYMDGEDNNTDYPFSSLGVTMRLKKTGITSFLKAYINLFAVVIWIIIAFFSEAYHGESSLGMLGTGLFAAISSIIIGLNMVSDASFFSLLTMINIFTLFVILLMTYQSIMVKNAQIKKDNASMAYYGIQLRILFLILSITTLIVFIGLPIICII